MNDYGQHPQHPSVSVIVKHLALFVCDTTTYVLVSVDECRFIPFAFCFSTGEWFDTPKVIVEQSRLESLLTVCRSCSGQTQFSKQKNGGYFHYAVICLDCGKEFTFETTPKIGR